MTAEKHNKIIVALPAYNEGKHIAEIVSAAITYSDAVFVLDDGSTDDTVIQASRAGATVVKHEVNRGYGATIQSILSHARTLDDLGILVIIDADGQHFPSDIPGLVKAVQEGYDLVIGCRAGSDIPFYRRIGGTVLSIFTCLLSGTWVRDSQCGFRAYSRKAVQTLKPTETDMSVGSEVVGIAGRSGLRITEVPISIRYTNDSSTQNPTRQGFYTLWRIVVMMMRRRLGK